MSEVKQNSFCVPFALAFIAGLTPNEIAAAIKSYLVNGAKENAKRYARESRQAAGEGNISRAKTYKGMAESAAVRAEKNARMQVKGVNSGTYLAPAFLTLLGLTTKAHVSHPGMTIKSWCQVREKWGDKGSWLIANSGHALVYRDGIIYDNARKQGRPYAAHPYASARLQHATLLERLTTVSTPAQDTRPSTQE